MNEVIEKTLQVLEEGLTRNQIEHYYNGKPIDPSALPKAELIKGVICVYPITSDTTIDTTNQDRSDYTVGVLVAKNVQNQYNKQAKKILNFTQMVKLVESFDTTTSPATLKTNTIRSIIRRAYNRVALGHTFTVEYDVEEINNEMVAQALIILEFRDLTLQSYG